MSGGRKQFIARRYELIDQAGEGGMATVWRGVQHGAAGFTRQVAIKHIKPEFQAIQNYINMFVEEARVGSDLAHPNIVQVHDFIIDEKSYYLVMEWVEGLDLGSLVRAFLRAKLPTPWTLIAQVCIDGLRGLSAAHERRRHDGARSPIIHRDVSPHNILVSVNGMAKLTDFGLARARDRLFSLTAPGTVKGKLTYLSPEVSYGQQATPLSDLFSMGNVMWESLAGRRLFRGATDLETFRLIRECRVPSLSDLRPDIPKAVTGAVERSLAREPADRFPSARAMAYELSSAMRESGWSEDSRLQLGYATLAARSKKGVPLDWQERAKSIKPRWFTKRLDSKKPTEDALNRTGSLKAMDIEFIEDNPSQSVDIEFSDPNQAKPR